VIPHVLAPSHRWWLALAGMLLAIAFCVAMLVLTANYWLEAWSQRWLSNTMWRVRLWIP